MCVQLALTLIPCLNKEIPVCVCVCVRARVCARFNSAYYICTHTDARTTHIVVELTMLNYFKDCVQLMRDTCVGVVTLFK